MEPFSIQKPEWYESIYKDKDYKYEAEYLLHIFKKNNPYKPVILDVGAGTGKLISFLINNSTKYIALEPNKLFCKFIDKRYSFNKKVFIENSSFENYVSKADKDINLVVANFNVMNYIKYENFLELTNTIYKKLKSKSIFIFDLWSLEYVLKQSAEMNSYKIISNKSNKKNNVIVRFSNSIFNKKESNIQIKFNFVRVNPTSMENLGSEMHKIMPYSIEKLIDDMIKQGWKILKLNEIKHNKYSKNIDFSSQRNWFISIQKI